MKFGAIILAAGASSRMGQPKALLKIGYKTFLQHLADILCRAGLDEIVMVLGAKAEEIEKHLGQFPGRIVVNEKWKSGQLSSILTGLDVLKLNNLDGVFICPVDRPSIAQNLITEMIVQFSNKKKQIVVPTFETRRGHPVLFGAAMFDELRKASHETGARQVLWNHPDKVLEYPTDNEGILVNIDTRKNYKDFAAQTKSDS
jgi:molybdenum cofactor cytidylyltransferase